MTVKQRLNTLIGTALAGLLLLAVLGGIQIARVFQAANYGNVKSAPSLVILDNAFKPMAASRPVVWQFLITRDTEERVVLERKLESLRQETDEALKEYEALASDPKDSELLAKDKQVLSVYYAMRDQMILLAKAGKDSAAFAYFRSNAQLATAVWDTFLAHNSYNVAQAKLATVHARSILIQAIVISVLISLLVIVGMVLLGKFVTRKLLGQLGGEPDYAAEIARKVAEGGFNVQVITAPGDESSLLFSMKQMCSQLLTKLGGIPIMQWKWFARWPAET